jgi:ferredoxin
MAEVCPICGISIESGDLKDHLLSVHKDAPGIEEPKPEVHGHRCVLCGTVLPTAEALKEHNATRHHA